MQTTTQRIAERSHMRGWGAYQKEKDFAYDTICALAELYKPMNWLCIMDFIRIAVADGILSEAEANLTASYALSVCI